MPERPAGTATFLFTDVERSTRLDELGAERRAERRPCSPIACGPDYLDSPP